ncbi:MAG: serine/threonine protein kinase [Bauldia sp.]
MSRPATVHASALLAGETGILIRGASGSGKSSLLLALLDRASPARLVADDRVILRPVHDRLLAFAPVELAGLVEIRGQGIVRRPFVSPVVIRLVVDLLPPELCARFPDMVEAATLVDGVELACLRLPAGAAEGALRVAAAVIALRP